jgi:hypothetical protein
VVEVVEVVEVAELADAETEASGAAAVGEFMRYPSSMPCGMWRIPAHCRAHQVSRPAPAARPTSTSVSTTQR